MAGNTARPGNPATYSVITQVIEGLLAVLWLLPMPSLAATFIAAHLGDELASRACR